MCLSSCSLHSYDRLITLSNDVFAIAATLAAFEIKMPDAWLTKMWLSNQVS